MFYYNKGSDERRENFIAETEADIAKLPTSTVAGDMSASIGNAYQKVEFGSMALCVQTGDIYMLTSNNQWTKMGS